MSEQKWADLDPDPAMVAALDRADAGGTRADALLCERVDEERLEQSLADACAVMVADELRQHPTCRSLIVRPEDGGTAEPLTFVAGDRSKKVDVVVSSIVSGLQLGFSLKGMNFRDKAGMQFDKNLTGRTYELQDEVSVIHRYQPAAFLVALYFMPIAATVDKRSETSTSSFARAVTHLRARTGRLDPTLPSQMDRVDAAAIALYVPGDVETGGEYDYADDLPRGVVRYFDVETDPPKRGRPRVGTTLGLHGLVDRIASTAFPSDESISWAEPEN